MKKKTNKVVIIPAMLIMFLCIALAGCNTPAQTGAPGRDSGQTEAVGTVLPGGWEGGFSIGLANGTAENWIVDFFVNDDGKTVSSVELIHYIGDLTPDTNATALLTVIDAEITNNSFDFTLSELVSYSMNTYEGSVTFTSSKEAEGILNIDGDDNRFTAVPFDD